MPFDSREYVVHFRLIQPVEKRGGGGGGGVQMLSPFGPFNQSVGGRGGLLSALVRFNRGGGGGGGFCPLSSHSISGGGGGGGGWCCPLLAHSISGGGGGGGIYVNFCYKGAIQSQRRGGGAMAPLPPL